MICLTTICAISMYVLHHVGSTLPHLKLLHSGCTHQAGATNDQHIFWNCHGQWWIVSTKPSQANCAEQQFLPLPSEHERNGKSMALEPNAKHGQVLGLTKTKETKTNKPCLVLYGHGSTSINDIKFNDHWPKTSLNTNQLTSPTLLSPKGLVSIALVARRLVSTCSKVYKPWRSSFLASQINSWLSCWVLSTVCKPEKSAKQIMVNGHITSDYS